MGRGDDGGLASMISNEDVTAGAAALLHEQDVSVYPKKFGLKMDEVGSGCRSGQRRRGSTGMRILLVAAKQDRMSCSACQIGPRVSYWFRR
jgi:hypothetical protein